jgi:hypothetical protein
MIAYHLYQVPETVWLLSQFNTRNKKIKNVVVQESSLNGFPTLSKTIEKRAIQ